MNNASDKEIVIIPINESHAAVACDCAVGFLKFVNNSQELVGGGTFVQLGKTKGILTAGHALEKLPVAGQIGPVRFPRIKPEFQNLRLQMDRTGRIMLWDKIEEHAPDLGFLKLADYDAANIEALGGVFYNLAKERDFAPSSPSHRMSTAHAVVGIVDEWTEEVSVDQPQSRKKIFGGLFGAVKTIRDFDEDGTQLVEIEVDYAQGPQISTSYGGVSGGALWQLHFELDAAKKLVRPLGKKLLGVAFRQSEDHRLISCNGTPSIDNLVTEIAKQWPHKA
jgi:hypothetical protein